MKTGSALARGLALAAALLAATPVWPAVIHTEPSRFSPVVVYEERGERCMTFGSVHAAGRQTCYALQAPDRMVFGYTRMMMSSLFAAGEPRRILIVGLGGGTLPTALARVLPEASIETVEIDPAVVRVAERFFGFRQGERQRVVLEDGRKYVEQAAAEGREYDLVMLDAFDVDYIPRHLMTREFLQTVRGLLAPGGILAANTFSASSLYQQESATYAAVFGRFYNLRSSNRVIIAGRDGLPDADALRANAEALRERLAPFGIDVDEQLALFSTRQDWPTGTRVLTD